MAESKINSTKKGFSIDWLMRGVLTKLGETFDKLTGRNWKPSSSLATSELIERLKLLLDADAKKTDGDNKRFVPHHIQLKMQWDKFSTDAESALKKLETELLIAAIDHINDKRYHTLAPLRLEIKPDYFTEGVRLQASFDGKFGSEAESEAAINVTVPDLKNIQLNSQPEIPAAPPKEIYIAEFTVKTAPRKKELAFAEKQRLSVGRTKENDLWIDDPSVSKIHAALVLNSDKQLMVADTGSTNGTFVNNQRISYGKAIVINDSDKLKFGTVEVSLKHIIKEEIAADSAIEKTSPDFSASETLTARQINSSNETAAEEEKEVNQQNFDQTIKVAETLDPNSKLSREIASNNGDRQTGQRIVLDFEENK